MAASATGWWMATSLPCWSPVGKTWRQHATSPAMTPMRRAAFVCVGNVFISAQWAATAFMAKAPVTTAAHIVWRYSQMAQGFVR